MTQWFYEKNKYLLENPINRTFEELLLMSADEFRGWVKDLRVAVVFAWDTLGIPPRVGYDQAEIIDQFQQIESYPVHELLVKDELTGDTNLLRNTSSLGNAVNQFFPTMMKTRINYTKDPSSGKSIYDFFAREDLFDTFLTYATRHFKRDSFYHYSLPALKNQNELLEYLPIANTGVEWIFKFESENYRNRGHYDYWLGPVKDDQAYTGYAEHLKEAQTLSLTRSEIESLGILIPERCKTNIDWDRSELYRIRYYTHGQKVFPLGFKAFRVSYCQYAVNFPPLVAKYIYDTFTNQWKDEENIFIWDPSAGWGGRLLGALGAKDDRHLIYLTNDPNTDHNTISGRTKYHEIADFYHQNVRKGGMWNLDHNALVFWQKGSEEMQFDKSFQFYKGKLSLVFTSPPYFAKEAYSEDPEQSYKKFSGYELWRDGFLKETLKTAVEWLRPGGFLAWNIADAQFGGELLPLEEDSLTILRQFNMHHRITLKLVLGQMPGGNRLDATTGQPKFKNACKHNGLWFKYEPIFIFQKLTH